MLETTFTWARLPGKCPIRTFEKFTTLRVIPPAFINSPARIKNGTASKGNEFNDINNLWGIKSGETSPSPMTAKVPEIAMAKATGIPEKSRIINIIIINMSK